MHFYNKERRVVEVPRLFICFISKMKFYAIIFFEKIDGPSALWILETFEYQKMIKDNINKFIQQVKSLIYFSNHKFN